MPDDFSDFLKKALESSGNRRKLAESLAASIRDERARKRLEEAIRMAFPPDPVSPEKIRRDDDE